MNSLIRCLSRCYSILFIVGFVLVLIEAFACFKVAQAESWDSVSGRITEFRVERISLGSRNTRFEQVLKYKYAYQGETREGDEVGFDDMISTIGMTGFDITGRTLGMHKGQDVTVYVNPRNPEETVLKRDLGRFNMLMLGIGVVTLGVGGVGTLKQLIALVA